MRAVYYTRTCLLDTALPRIRELSKLVELHAILELSPESWQSGLFDVSKQLIGSGVHEGARFLNHFFIPALHKYWQQCASVSIAVHTHTRSIHPTTWYVSHQVMKYIRKLKPDVVHLDDVSLRLAPMLPELNNLPVVLNIHDSQSHSGEQSWRKEVARWLTFRKVKHFILQSDFSRKQFLQHYAVPESRVTMIPLGILDIYREWMRAEIPEEPNTVLFFGRISPYKGVEVFVKAAELVSVSLANCRFIIAGRPINGYSLPDLPQLSRGNAFEIYRQYLTNAQVASLISRTSLVVCPYLDASQSGVVLTAYAFNKPVIATNVGGLPEYVWEGETGVLVPPGDTVALSGAIVNLLTDREKRAHMQRAIEEKNRTVLNWDQIAHRMMELYERVVTETL